MKLVIIGTGNVAEALGTAFRKAGHSLVAVAGRNEHRAKALARKWKTCFITDFSKVPCTADCYLIAVSDDAIAEMVTALPLLKRPVVHTAGSIPMNVLRRFPQHGVFYPLETIRAGKRVAFAEVPLCIEASCAPVEKKLRLLATAISREVHVVNSRKRLALHTAAVFACNFTNYLLRVAGEVLEKNDLSPLMIRQLVITTVNNAFAMGPVDAQTGPARRGDRITIAKHLKFLESDPPKAALYRMITRQIGAVYKPLKKDRKR